MFYRKLTLLALSSILIVSSIEGQPICNEQDCCDSSAYSESCYQAHWSAYVPIAILVAAAIFWGIADTKDSDYRSSDSQNGLGRLRHSKKSYSSSEYSCNSRYRTSRVVSSHSHF